MGWLGDIIDVVASPFTLPFGNYGGVTDMFEKGHDVPNVALPALDQKSNYLKALQKRVADKYEQDLGLTIDQGEAVIKAKGNQALDSANRQTDQNMNSRGLLFSGKRGAERDMNAADIAGQVGQQAGEYEQGARDKLSDLRADAIDTDINQAWNESEIKGLTNDQYANKLSNALKRRMQGQAAMGQFTQGVGKIGGAAVGGAFG